MILSKYDQTKAAILWMIRHYATNCLNYVNRTELTLDDLTALFDHDEQMIEKYQGQLLVLEAKHLIDLI